MHFSRNTSRAGSRAHALALLLAVFAVAGALPAQAGDCPTNGIEKPGFTYSAVSATYQTTPVTSWGRTVYDGWDLTTGVVRIHHWGGLGNSVVHAADLYDVTGVPPGTKVTVILRMDVAAWAATDGCGGTGCAGYVGGQITTPEQTRYQHGIGSTFGGFVAFGFYVDTPLTLTAGTPVPVSYMIEAHRTAGGNHEADGVGTFRFLGLTNGQAVVSCQGYRDPSTPAFSSSWGGVKALYR